jgi:hypothetical protein
MSGPNGSDPGKALRKIQERIEKQRKKDQKAIERGRRKQAKKARKRKK